MRTPTVYRNVIVSEPTVGSFAQARIEALRLVGMKPKYVSRVKRVHSYVKHGIRFWSFTIERP